MSEYAPREPLNCPLCSANLIGDEIPAEDQHLFGASHFKREIGIYDLYLDKTVEWECPDCKGRWE